MKSITVFVFVLMMFQFSNAQTYATLPFIDDFESASLNNSWVTNPDLANNGLVDLAGGWGANNSIGLRIGKSSDGAFATNSVDLYLNLSGQSNVFLSFAIRDYFEETHFQDAIYMSNDGGANFERVFAFEPEVWCNDFGRFPPFSVDQLAASVGLSLTGQFVIRFQQYDNADFNVSSDEDGLILDNVEVIARPPVYSDLPFEDNFDTGTGILGESWSWSHPDQSVIPLTGTAKPSGFVGLVNGQGINGSFGLMMGKNCDDGFTANAVDLHLNLLGKSDVFLSFAIRDYFEETHAQDGLFFSDNGGLTFTKVYTFSPTDWCNNTWGEFPPFSIDQLAASNGIEFTDQFIIRFQQYDNADFNVSSDEDGFILDNVEVFARPPVYASLPFEDQFDDGTGELGSSWAWSHPDLTIAPLVGTVKPTGYVDIVGAQGLAGSFGLMLGKICDDGFTSNTVDLHVNLEGETDVFLSFAIRDYFEENHLQDAIYFSDNGGVSFEKVYTFSAEAWCNNTWGSFPPFSVDELANAVGLSLTNQFIIRFQQYDNSDFNVSSDEDGFILDDVRVYARSPEYASLPFCDNFDDGIGTLGPNWSWSHPDTTIAPLEGTVKPTGLIAIANETGTNNSFGLLMGKICDDGFTSNALDLHLNLEGLTDVFLSFAIRSFFEENHFQDGLYFSDNGGLSFEKVYGFSPDDWCDNVWGEFPPFPIDKLAANVGLEMTSQFIVRFQQYDNADFNVSSDEDGFVLDDLCVYTKPTVHATLPFCEDFDDGTGTLSESMFWSFADSTIFPLEGTTKPTGFVGIVNQQGTDNTFGLMMGKRGDDGFTSNALDIRLNLAGASNVELSFSIREFFEETQPLQDVIYFSNDGGLSFTSLYTFDFDTNPDNVFVDYTLNLDSLVDLTGLNYTDRSIIRFQQYDNADFNVSSDEDGYVLDNIDVYANGLDCSLVSTENLEFKAIDLKILPNPNNGQFNIQTSDLEYERLDLRILNLQGQVLHTASFTNTNNVEVNVAHLSLNGVYLLQINGAHFSTTEKIFITTK